MNEVKQWFADLDEREKILVLVAAFAVIFFLFYMFIWSPIQDKKETAQRKYQVEQENLRFLQANQTQLRQLSGGSVASKDISSIVSRASKSNGLTMKSFKPQGVGKAQVTFEKVSFNKVLDWMHTLEQSNQMQLEKVVITEAGDKNIVDARINISQ